MEVHVTLAGQLELGMQHAVKLGIKQTLELLENCSLCIDDQVHAIIPLCAVHQVHKTSTA